MKKWIASALVVVWLIAATWLFALHHGDKPVHANAVFVLSGSSARLPVGVKLVREGYAPLLVVSRTTPNPTKLEQQACSGKLDVKVLCVRADPYSTVGEAELISRLAAERRWSTLDVVTSEYHVVRARIIVGRCFHGDLRVVGAPDGGLVSLLSNEVLESIKLPYHELVHRGC